MGWAVSSVWLHVHARGWSCVAYATGLGLWKAALASIQNIHCQWAVVTIGRRSKLGVQLSSDSRTIHLYR
jgi:hypothetical protein